MILKNNLLIAFSSSMLLTLAGCGGSSSSSGDGDDSSPTTVAGFPAGVFDDNFFDDECEFQDGSCYDEIRPNSAGSNGVSISRFDGNWVSECARAADDDALFGESSLSDSVVMQMAISGHSATRTVSFFTDGNCTTPAVPAVVTSELDIFYAGEFDDTSDDIARSLEDANPLTFGFGTDEVFIERAIVNLTATNIAVDGAEPTAEELEALEARRAFRTRYTILGTRLGGARLGEGNPGSDTSGRSSDSRILGHFNGNYYSYNLQ